MFRYLLPFRRLLATSFLLVFVNVLAGQCWCAGLRASKALETAEGKAAARPAPMKADHSCCKSAAGRNAAAPATRATPDKLPLPQKHSGPNDCCKDKSASLLSSLSAPAEKHFFVAAPALLPAAADFHFRPAAGQWNRTGAVVLVPRQHLPPKIPDIRIYIQSLTV